jgi:Cytochrome c3
MRVKFNFRLASFITALVLSAIPRVSAEVHSNPLNISAADAKADVHSHKGMNCATCHASRETQSPKSAAATSAGPIRREKVNQLCGSCHADAVRMKQFNPSMRTDQLPKYQTSVHGIKFAHGDSKVAVCTDCHGAHGIRPASDPLSPVHPLNVATTCQRCHADADYMKAYGIKTDQFSEYTNSVHHKAMKDRGDLSAPTCSTCHGSHGAVPPGVNAVANVCSTCHMMQAKFFDQSPHKDLFADGCATCHGSHAIKHPTDDFIGMSAGAACASCHGADDEGGKAATAIHQHLAALENDIAHSKAVLDRAEHFGMDVSDAQVELKSAGDALTKARVSLHTAQLSRVDEDLQAGSKIVAKSRTAGEAALAERQHRRRGLWIPLSAILAVVLSLVVYIREMERNGSR